MLCTGDVPGVLFAAAASGAKGIESSGFGVRPCDAIAQLTATTFASYVASEGKLVISSLDAKISHRINALTTPVRQTIPKMRLIPQWGNTVLAAVREPLQDSIASFYVANGAVNKSTRVAAPFTLLESERCEFIEFVELNGAPFIVAEGEVPQPQNYAAAANSTNPFNHSQNATQQGSAYLQRSAAAAAANSQQYNSSAAGPDGWDPTAPFSAALIGTNFAYPSDDIPRNGRIMLIGMERTSPASAGSSSNKTAFVQLCERDIRGMVMCACMVPRTNNRILVGVTGCVQMYRWSPTDRSFVFEISASFGAAITRLIPLAGSSLGAMKARPLPPQIVAATPAMRAAAPVAGGRRGGPASNTSSRTLGGFSTVTMSHLGGGGQGSSSASPTFGGGANATATDDAFEDRETSSLVLCADMRNSLAVIALNPVELMRIAANERAFREVLDVIPAGNKAFVEPRTGLRVYDPHFITSDTDLNLFIISALKDRRAGTADDTNAANGGGLSSMYHLKGIVPQLTVCGQFHVGDRVTVLQRGSLQVARKIRASGGRPNTMGGFSTADSSAAVTVAGTLDAASAAAAAAGNALARIATPTPATTSSPNNGQPGGRGAHLPDLTARYADPFNANNSNTLLASAGVAASSLSNEAAPIIARGVRDSSLPSFIYGTVHGAMGSITPLNPLAFNYLVILQRCLVRCIRPVGNLSYDQFRKVFNRETSVATTSTPHFAEPRDGDDSSGKRTARHKAYNFVDGDLLQQFLAPTATPLGYSSSAVSSGSASSSAASASSGSGCGLDEAGKILAVHAANKAIRAAAFSGELFRGTAVDAKRLGLGGATPTTAAAEAILHGGANAASHVNNNPAAIAAAAAAQHTPTVLGGPSFTAAQQQPPASVPATPMSIHPREGVRSAAAATTTGAGATSLLEAAQQQATAAAAAPAAALLTDANGVAYDAEGNKVEPARRLAVAKRTTFTPAEIGHLNELLGLAELPEYPLTVDSCERFLSDLQRYC